jgi:hypothetical protein
MNYYQASSAPVVDNFREVRLLSVKRMTDVDNRMPMAGITYDLEGKIYHIAVPYEDLATMYLCVSNNKYSF